MAQNEFEKRMQLLDPGYVAPVADRVANRSPVDSKAGPRVINEAGLEVKQDLPVNSGMQELYLRRMMDMDALEKLEAQTKDVGTISPEEQKKLQQDADRQFYAQPARAQALIDLGIHSRGGLPELSDDEEKELEASMNLPAKQLNPRQKMMVDVFTDQSPLEALSKRRQE